MCGVIGLRTRKPEEVPLSELAFQSLLTLQHRGQDAAGLSVLSKDGFHTVRGLGLVVEALRDVAQVPKGRAAVAHARYATTGTGGVAEVQPFVRGVPKIAIAHNGNIVNTAELARKHSLQVANASDLEVISQIFLHSRATSFEAAVQTLMNELNGSYAVVGVESDGSLFAFRDPFGIRPLWWLRTSEWDLFASESVAFGFLEGQAVELKPGEWIRITDSAVERGILTSQRNLKHSEKACMFERIYFSSPASEVGGESVYRTRFNLGTVLANEIKKANPDLQVDYVVPVPETARPAAIAVAEALLVPYREYLVKNTYVSRTFILSSQEARLKALDAKLSLIGPEIHGKRILLVDDSVVRGNTSKRMAARFRAAGATAVYLASTCPPIRHGCFYGIDFPDPNELVAHAGSLSEIESRLGVDGLYYLSLEGLYQAIGTSKLCVACLTGDYPTQDASFSEFLADRRSNRSKTKDTVL
jgi:amidophosphoribosyltransferase